MIVLGIGSLGINLPILIAQLVNFTILLVVLRLVAWGPLVKMLDERRGGLCGRPPAAGEEKAEAAGAGRPPHHQIEAGRRRGPAAGSPAAEVAPALPAEPRP